jgi:hypothetical protein
MKNKNINTIGTVSKFNRKCIDSEAISLSEAQLYITTYFHCWYRYLNKHRRCSARFVVFHDTGKMYTTKFDFVFIYTYVIDRVLFERNSTA